MDKRRPKGRPPHEDILTPAEWKIAEGVRHGLSNPDIAKRQGVSMNAVKFHVANILSKLSMESRTQLQKWDGVRVESQLTNRTTIMPHSKLSSIGQIARFVSDIEKNVNWYRDVLGLTHLFTHGDLAFFDCDGTRLFLNIGDVKANSIIYFNVDDVHLTYRTLTEQGVEVVSAPHMIHTHEDGSEEWMAFFNDPDGQPLGLISKTSPSQDT